MQLRCCRGWGGCQLDDRLDSRLQLAGRDVCMCVCLHAHEYVVLWRPLLILDRIHIHNIKLNRDLITSGGFRQLARRTLFRLGHVQNPERTHRTQAKGSKQSGGQGSYPGNVIWSGQKDTGACSYIMNIKDLYEAQKELMAKKRKREMLNEHSETAWQQSDA